MREAWHKNDDKVYLIPQILSKKEIENHKQLAKKGAFTCPYCEARLTVKSGDIRGNFFSHLHGEGCELSKKSEARYYKYKKQKKNDTPRQQLILTLMNNELELLSNLYPYLSYSFGYINPDFSKFVPDLSLKINEHKYAITIITNITSSNDSSIAKDIQKQKSYYASLGYETLFFIERSHIGIDIDGHSLVLWATERAALTTQRADLDWKNFLTQLAPIAEQQQVLKLPKIELNVQSIMYIAPANQEIAIEVFHVLEQLNTTPIKAYFLSNPYTLSFSNAFKLENDSLTLADLQIESKKQAEYALAYEKAKKKYFEERENLELIRQEREFQFNMKAEDNTKQPVNFRKGNQDNVRRSAYQKATPNNRLEMLQRVYNSNN